MVLKMLASLFLLLILITRIPALFWPKKAKARMKDFSKTNKNWSYALSFVLLAVGLIMLSLVARLTNLQTVLVSIFGYALLVGSFLMYNEMHKDIIKAVLKKSDKWLQKVALLKVVVAAILLWVLMY
ncbi:MAG: hypothetical protein HY051_02055 [Candidatus Aenigmarchaeota archaeon]|nr:hypothetical protein [Candidatus Aenigmarchaeota archaeon]